MEREVRLPKGEERLPHPQWLSRMGEMMNQAELIKISSVSQIVVVGHDLWALSRGLGDPECIQYLYFLGGRGLRIMNRWWSRWHQ